ILIIVFFFRTATPAISTLSLHDALPISGEKNSVSRTTTTRHPGSVFSTPAPPTSFCTAALRGVASPKRFFGKRSCRWSRPPVSRSEEYTSELQSREKLVCRLLLEKTNNH